MIQDELLILFKDIYFSIRPNKPAIEKFQFECYNMGQPKVFVFAAAFPDIKLALDLESLPGDIVGAIIEIERDSCARKSGWSVLTFSEADIVIRPKGVRMMILRVMSGMGCADSSALLAAVKIPSPAIYNPCDSAERPAVSYPSHSSDQLDGIR